MSHLKNHRNDRGLIPNFDDEELPELEAHFFYSSPLPIDDPFSPVPNTSGSEFKSMKHPLRPFSAKDSEALENAWRDLITSVITADDRSFPKSGQDLNSALHESHSPRWDTKIMKTLDHALRDESSELATFISAELGKDNSINSYLANHIKHNKPISTTKISQEIGNSVKTTNYQSLEQIPSDHCKRFSRVNGTENPSENIFIYPINVEESKRSNLCVDSMDHVHFDTLRNLKIEKSSLKRDENNCGITCSRMETQRKQGDNLIQDKLDSVDKDDSLNCVGERKYCFDQVSIPIQDPVSQYQIGNHFDVSITDENDSSKLSDRKALETQKSFKFSLSKIDIDFSSVERTKTGVSPVYNSKNEDTGTTGQPFIKLPTRPCSPIEYIQVQSELEGSTNRNQAQTTNDSHTFTEHKLEVVSNEELDKTNPSKIKKKKHFQYNCEVPVGISRLHLVNLPNLQMKPIYWSPVNDMAPVTRGTWFYRDTMYPVEPTVANQLEFGYRELKPWSQTWKDELESALNVGAAGEEKIAYRLWPSDGEKFRNKKYEQLRLEISSDLYCAARFFHGEIAAEGSADSKDEDPDLPEPKINFKKFSAAQIIYKDFYCAFILKPSLQPSAYYGRRPLQKISKGMTIGIPVVRGFAWKKWERLHPPKSPGTSKHQSYANMSKDTSLPKPDNFPFYLTPRTYVQPTDLVLIVHGIGQKLSERVETFNFTHAVNEFRRSMNTEMCNSSVRRVLRKDGFGIMVLPINWRANLSFEDGGLMKDDDRDHPKMDYSLPDVTQDSLPAVRQMITDVMLDIPYYMSKHKPKMIQAVIQEANRVYRLWCKHNRNFEKEGRVHLIAHSLGSIMVLEILSKQPTLVPKLDLDSKNLNSEYFDFKTTNCFFAGSPAGFFLLLEQAKLKPRRGLSKPEAETSNDKRVIDEAGTFGCMALDNIYNIMHYNDPIAYRLNATVDRKYAEGLKEAQLPTTSVGLFGSIGRAMRSITPGMTPVILDNTEEPEEQLLNPLSTAHLPSNLEMEVHDFNREKMAEKKFLLLNDNGQIDWYMNSGRGPLEIQYINMLGAHSSYWINSDFVRFVVVECGRKSGKSNTLTSIRAVKITRFGKQ